MKPEELQAIREHAKYEPVSERTVNDLCNEIERLRGALKFLRDAKPLDYVKWSTEQNQLHPYSENKFDVWEWFQGIARQALEG